MGNNGSVDELDQGMNNRLSMNDDGDPVGRGIKKPSGLNNLKPLVHKGCRIDGNFSSHLPVWMGQGLIEGNCRKILDGKAAKGPA